MPIPFVLSLLLSFAPQQQGNPTSPSNPPVRGPKAPTTAQGTTPGANSTPTPPPTSRPTQQAGKESRPAAQTPPTGGAVTQPAPASNPAVPAPTPKSDGTSVPKPPVGPGTKPAENRNSVPNTVRGTASGLKFDNTQVPSHLPSPEELDQMRKQAQEGNEQKALRNFNQSARQAQDSVANSARNGQATSPRPDQADRNLQGRIEGAALNGIRNSQQSAFERVRSVVSTWYFQARELIERFSPRQPDLRNLEHEGGQGTNPMPIFPPELPLYLPEPM